METTKGSIITRECVSRIIDQFFNKVPTVHPQKLNESIKELGRDIGITEAIQMEKYKGGKKYKYAKS